MFLIANEAPPPPLSPPPLALWSYLVSLQSPRAFLIANEALLFHPNLLLLAAAATPSPPRQYFGRQVVDEIIIVVNGIFQRFLACMLNVVGAGYERPQGLTLPSHLGKGGGARVGDVVGLEIEHGERTVVF